MQAAEQEYPNAITNVGCSYSEGVGVPLLLLSGWHLIVAQSHRTLSPFRFLMCPATAWHTRRNYTQKGVDWQFTTEDARWTVRLIAEKSVELKLVESLSHMSVHNLLKKHSLSLTWKPVGAFRQIKTALLLQQWKMFWRSTPARTISKSPLCVWMKSRINYLIISVSRCRYGLDLQKR